MESIIESLGTKQFTRLRIGVQPEHPIEDPIGYLLTPVRRSRRPQMEAIVDRAAEAVEAILRLGAARAMTAFNRREASSDPAPRRSPAATNAKEAIH